LRGYSGGDGLRSGLPIGRGLGFGGWGHEIVKRVGWAALGGGADRGATRSSGGLTGGLQVGLGDGLSEWGS